MTPVEWGGLFGLISSIVAAIFAYRQHKINQELESQKLKSTQEKEFIQDAMGRVDKLESRVDTLTDKVLDTAKNAEEERRKIVAESEVKIEAVRKEMRRLIDDAQFELATWRDRYFKLVDEYSKLRAEYANLDIKFNQLDKEYKELRGMYRRRAGDKVSDMDVRTSPDIGDTA